MVLFMGKIKDPGFGYTSSIKSARMINSDGSFNIKHVNSKFSFSEIYSHLINMSWLKFLVLIFLGYTLTNIIFASLYVFFGLEQLSIVSQSFGQDFLHAFFFSAQTLTTLGYGLISPIGNIAGFISAFEALIGLLSFAFFTGLLYGRFSKPKAAIRFSDVMVLRPFKDGNALMFRLMNKRKNIMIEPEISVTMAVNELDDFGNVKRNFFKLNLEREHIMYLPTTWTIVHEINKKSPLNTYSFEAIEKLNAELFILIKYYEDAYAQQVYQIHSYSFDSIKSNNKFVDAYYFDQKGNAVLDHKKLSCTESIH